MKKRGFASMDKKKQRRIASLGGKAAQKKGTGHQWTKEEASLAGRKGGSKRRGTPLHHDPYEALVQRVFEEL